MKVSTGVIQANAYARKLRSVLYATTKSKLDTSKTNEKASQINQYLLNIFKEQEIDKKDVVRVRFEFEITEEEEIEVDWDTVEIEVYKKERIISGLQGPES